MKLNGYCEEQSAQSTDVLVCIRQIPQALGESPYQPLFILHLKYLLKGLNQENLKNAYIAVSRHCIHKMCVGYIKLFHENTKHEGTTNFDDQLVHTKRE